MLKASSRWLELQNGYSVGPTEFWSEEPASDPLQHTARMKTMHNLFRPGYKSFDMACCLYWITTVGHTICHDHFSRLSFLQSLDKQQPTTGWKAHVAAIHVVAGCWHQSVCCAAPSHVTGGMQREMTRTHGRYVCHKQLTMETVFASSVPTCERTMEWWIRYPAHLHPSATFHTHNTRLACQCLNSNTMWLALCWIAHCMKTKPNWKLNFRWETDRNRWKTLKTE